MTAAQRKVYDTICDYVDAHGVPPTLQEIATELGCSRITVWEHAQRLIESGHLKKDGSKRRSLVPVIQRCPHCGRTF